MKITVLIVFRNALSVFSFDLPAFFKINRIILSSRKPIERVIMSNAEAFKDKVT